MIKRYAGLHYNGVEVQIKSCTITTRLYKYGIDITNATLATYAYNLGISKSVSEMSQAEKQQLRVLAILDQSKVSWGDLANTISSPSNLIRQFKNNLAEAGMVLGQLFIPMLSKVMPVINGVTIAVKRLLVSIAQLMGVKIDFEAFGKSTFDLGDGFDALTDSIDDTAKSAEKARKGIRSFDELNVIDTSSSSSKGTAVGGNIDLTNEIIKATEEYKKVWNNAFENMQNEAQKWADKVEPILSSVGKVAGDISVGDWYSAGQDTSQIVEDIFNWITDTIEKVNWEDVGTKIGLFLAGINWTDVGIAVVKAVWAAIKATWKTWNGALDAAPVETSIITAIGILKFTGLGGTLTKALTKPLTDGILGALASISGSSSIAGGIAGLFTADLGLIFSAGTFAEKGVALGGALAGGIAAGWAGYKLGLSLREIDINGVSVGEYADAFVTTIVDNWELAGKSIKDIWGDITDFFNEELPKWWNEDVAPWFTKEKWSEIYNNIKEALSEKWDEIKEWWKNSAISKWWNEDVAPWFTKEKWKTIFKDAKEGLKEGWNSYNEWFQNTALVKWWNSTKVNFKKDKWNFSGIKDGLAEAWNNAVTAVKDIWNKFAQWLNDKLSFDIPALNIGGVEIYGGTHVTLGKLPMYEDGGYIPSKYSLLMAGENGVPEIAGTVGGKSAVAGGAEITGIREAVYSTAEQELAEMREQNRLLRQLLNKEFGITQNDIGKASRAYAREQYNKTGKNAFVF